VARINSTNDPRGLGGAALAAALALAAGGCRSPAPPAAAAWTAPRLSVNQRALHAPRELEALAAALLEQARTLRADRPARIAFSYVTCEGRKDRLGESIAQDLATLMAQGARGTVEVYSRRKLAAALEELGRQMSPLYDEQEIVRAGRLAGVAAILGGRRVREPDAVLLNLQLLGVETGRIAGGRAVRIPPMDFATSAPSRSLPAAAEGLAAAIAAGLDPAAAWRIAVYDLTRGSEPFTPGAEVAEGIATALAGRYPHVAPLTRARLGELLEEQRLQSSDLFDEATCARLGRLMGGNAVLTGFGEIFRDFYALNVQVVEVESARIRTGAFALLERRPGNR